MINTIKNLTSIFKRTLDLSPFIFDFGTSTLRIYVPEKGRIFLPCLEAYHIHKKEYLFYGREAKNLKGKLPKEIEIIQPIKKGVVHNFDALFALLKATFEDEILKNWKEFKLKLPFLSAVVAVPGFSTEIEQRASVELLKKIGFNKVYAIYNLVALGYAIFKDFSEASPSIIADIGAGKTEVGVVGRGGVILSKSSDISGNYLDEKVKNYLYIKYGMIIGDNTAEKIKNKLLTFEEEENSLTVRGKALDTGLPKQIKVTSSEIKEALLPYFYQISDLIRQLIEESPPEIIEEIVQNGIHLVGGLAKTPKIENFFESELKINTKPYPSQDLVLAGLRKISSFPKLLFYSSVN